MLALQPAKHVSNYFVASSYLDKLKRQVARFCKQLR